MRVLALLLMVVATVLGAVGQLYFKKGAMGAADLVSLIFNFNTLLGLALYGVATVIYLYALRIEELSRLSPIIALSYLWTVILAVVVLGERVPLLRWVGVLLILVGVALVVS